MSFPIEHLVIAEQEIFESLRAVARASEIHGAQEEEEREKGQFCEAQP